MKSNIAKYQPLITEDQILEAASQIISRELYKREIFNSCEKVKVFLQCKLSRQEREIFSIILLDNQHRMIKYEELFQGTINAAPVYPREVVKMVMKSNAAAVIFSHNHPSGDSNPSTSDRRITERLIEALNLIDVRVLDHIIIGHEAYSFAENGLL